MGDEQCKTCSRSSREKFYKQENLELDTNRHHSEPGKATSWKLPEQSLQNLKLQSQRIDPADVAADVLAAWAAAARRPANTSQTSTAPLSWRQWQRIGWHHQGLSQDPGWLLISELQTGGSAVSLSILLCSEPTPLAAPASP